MSQKTISKQAYLKKATFHGNDVAGKTLQSVLGQALNKLPRIGNRKEELGEDKRYVRSIIFHRSYANMLFGIFASYERGTHQLTVSENDEAEMLSIEQVAPPKGDDDKRREFLEGVCYFGILGNHIALAQSKALGVKPFEYHINTLIRRSKVLAEGSNVMLPDQINAVTQEHIRRSHIKQVEIGLPLIEEQGIPNVFEDEGQGIQGTYEENERITIKESIGGRLLRVFLGDKVEKMNLSDAIDGNIDATLILNYKRKTTEKAHNLLDNIGLALRHVDEDETRMILTDGSKIKGRELKLSTKFNMRARDGVISPDELFERMHGWLTELHKNKSIDP